VATLKGKLEAVLVKALRRDIKAAGRSEAIRTRILQLLWVIIRELSGEQLTLRATSLVYTTLLSLVPLLAVSFSVLKGLGVHARLEILLYYFLEPLGPQGVDIAVEVIRFVEKVNVNVLGSIGLASLVYTVLSGIQKIERALNDIWQVAGTRSLALRFSHYMSVLILGPVLVFSATGLTASVMSSGFVHTIESIEPFGVLFYYLGKLLPAVMVCAAFTFLYYTLPNTRVRFGSAVAGGVLAGLSWIATGLIFTSFVVSSAQYSAIYSGFAVLILFLLWLYWSFLILLIGASVSFHYQNPWFIGTGEEECSPSPRFREKLALSLMYLIGSSFREGRQPWKTGTISEHLGIPAGTVREVMTALVRRGLLLISDDEPPAYSPAKDMGAIAIKEIIDAVSSGGDDTGYQEETLPAAPAVEALMNEIEKALSDSLANRTLSDLVLQRKT
jgi:membrane protein